MTKNLHKIDHLNSLKLLGKFQSPNAFVFKELQVMNENHSFAIWSVWWQHFVIVPTAWLLTPTLLCETSQLWQSNCF